MLVSFFAFVFLFSSVIILFLYGTYSVFVIKNWRRDYKIARGDNYYPTVTVVVPAYNEERTIQGKLVNLLKIHYPSEKMEIIVVDDGSTDNTLKIVRSFLGKGVKILRQQERKGKISALNLAFEHARGEVVIITDADIRTESNILEKVVPYFADKRVGAVCASQVLVNSNQSLSTSIESNYQGFYHLIRQAESAADSTIVFNGNFTAVRSDLLEKIPQEAGVDDVEIPIMVRKKGYRCLLIPEATFYDFAPTNFIVNWKQKIRRSQGIIKALWRHRDVLFNTQYGTYGKLIYPAEFCMNILVPYFFLSALVSTISLFVIDARMGFITFSITLSAICVILLFIYFDLKHSVKRGRINLSMFSAVWSLILAQFLLLFGSLKCIFTTGFHKWEKIEETRRLT